MDLENLHLLQQPFDQIGDEPTDGRVTMFTWTKYVSCL
jgi:hypothetical protein